MRPNWPPLTMPCCAKDKGGDGCPVRRYVPWGAAQGFKWVSQAAVPIAGIENRQLMSLWNRSGGVVYTHGERFYHFQGLRAFQQKSNQVWTPN